MEDYEKMKKVCFVHNFAQHYRAPIFLLIDKVYDCHWYFGENPTDIKTMDTSLLKKVSIVQNKIIYKLFYYQIGIPSLAFKKDYDCYIALGAPFCISTWLLFFLLKIFRPNCKRYMWSHGWYGKETKSRIIMKKVFFRLADGVFLYGNHAKKLMIEQGFNKNKLYVIHNSLDYDNQLSLRKEMKSSNIYANYFGNNNPVIVMIGRLNLRKHLDWLLKSLVLLKDGGKIYNLVLIGDGEDKSKLQQMTIKWRLDNQVWFYGACYDEKENARLLYNADLCVVPGDIGLTAIHSLMFGVPVITHNCFKFQGPEFEAIKRGKTGDFYNYGDIDSLAQCIDNWLYDKTVTRDVVRKACFKEIDENWTPIYQLNVIKQIIH